MECASLHNTNNEDLVKLREYELNSDRQLMVSPPTLWVRDRLRLGFKKAALFQVPGTDDLIIRGIPSENCDQHDTNNKPESKDGCNGTDDRQSGC